MTLNTPHPVRRTYAVASIQDLGEGMRILRLTPANGAPGLDFTAGQYVFLSASGHAPRPFSIASAPFSSTLDFHIRDSGQGFSAYAVQNLTTGDTVDVHGPFGTAVLQAGARPILAIAGGVGFAPFWSMAQVWARAGDDRPFYLYWGARDDAGLYFKKDIAGFAAAHARFFYTGVTDEGGQDPVRAACAALGDVSGFDIYVSGPPAMTAAAREVLARSGADPARIFGDAFSPPVRV